MPQQINGVNNIPGAQPFTLPQPTSQPPGFDIMSWLQQHLPSMGPSGQTINGINNLGLPPSTNVPNVNPSPSGPSPSPGSSPLTQALSTGPTSPLVSQSLDFNDDGSGIPSGDGGNNFNFGDSGTLPSLPLSGLPSDLPTGDTGGFNPSDLGNFAGDGSGGGGGLPGGLTTADLLKTILGGASVAGGFLNSANQNSQFQQNLQLEKQQLAQGATQLNPYAQQEDLARGALHAANVQNGPALSGGMSGQMIDPGKQARADVMTQYMDPAALTAAKANFDNTIANGIQQPGSAAPGSTGTAAQQAALQKALDEPMWSDTKGPDLVNAMKALGMNPANYSEVDGKLVQGSGPAGNSLAKSGLGTIGALAGQSLIPIPGVGAFLGGTVGNFLGSLF